MCVTSELLIGNYYKTKKLENVTANVELYNEYWQTDDQLVKHFFRCSLLNRWDCFDFDRALENAIFEIEYKLAEHGICDFEDYLENMYGKYDTSQLSQFTCDGDWVNISEDDVYEAIMRLHYDRCRAVFLEDHVFEALQDIVKRYNSKEWEHNQVEAIALFDACIHAEHHFGWVLEEVGDPDIIREEVDKEFE